MPVIAIDYTPAYEQTAGIGRYVRDLVAALAREDDQTAYHLFVAGTQQQTLPPPPGPNFAWKPTRVTPRWLARIWHRLHVPLPVEFFTGRVDLYHATDFVLPPMRTATRTILQVHDLSFVRVPDAAAPRLKAYLDRIVPVSVHRADHVLADSQATKDDLLELYGVSPDKVTVLYGGVDSRFQPVSDQAVIGRIRQKYRIQDAPFALSVGTVQPRKNYRRLIQALAQQDGLNLVIAGGAGWLADPIYQAVEETKMESRVQFIGFVDDVDLPALYSAAACFAFPSLYEGFGLPVLEAMACGVPVITSNSSSLPEAGGDAALLVDPYDVAAISDALGHIMQDTTRRETMIHRGFQHVQQFTWTESARKLQHIYRKML